MAWKDHAVAPPPGVALCSFEAIPEGGCHGVTLGPLQNPLDILLWRRQGTVRAYVNRCPHFSLPLNAQPQKFLLMSGDRIMCAWHCAVFDLQTGRCLDGPANGMWLEELSIALVCGQVIRPREA